MQDRISRLLNLLDKEDLDKDFAVLIRSNVNRFYFSEFESSEGILLITKKERYLLLDSRYFELANRKVFDLKVILTSKFLPKVKELLVKHDIKELLIESKTTSLNFFNELKVFLNDFEIIKKPILDKKIELLRQIKDKREIRYIKTAQKIAEEAFKYSIMRISEGTNEKDLALDIEFFMRRNGASSVSFDLIVLSGKNTSFPHGSPTNKKIKNGDFITIDVGAKYKGYCSDMTRTIVFNKVSDEQKEVYNIVLEAQGLALGKIKDGAKILNIDNKARSFIDNTKYKELFSHSLGHGVGLNVHESPSINKENENFLKENMVITVEPGIYIKNKFGVRIEDMVLVSKEGYKNLTNIDKNLIIV